MDKLDLKVREKINTELTTWGFGFYQFTREDKTESLDRGAIMEVYRNIKNLYIARGFDVHTFEYSSSNRKRFAEITVRP